MSYYVQFGPVKKNVMRNICLFMPYDAAALSSGKYQRRYVIRIWDDENKEIGSRTLSADKVEIERKGGRVIIKSIVAIACSANDPKNNTPIPEHEPSGHLRFFSTKTGDWTCLGAKKK